MIARLTLALCIVLAVCACSSRGGGAPDPFIGKITFSQSINDYGHALNIAKAFPANTGVVYATFGYSGLPGDAYISAICSYQGHVVHHQQRGLDGASFGSAWFRLEAKQGMLAPGLYRLELVVDDKVLQTGQFEISELPQPPVGPITFALGLDSDGEPFRAGASFPAGSRVSAFFEFAHSLDERALTLRWYHNGELDLQWDDWPSPAASEGRAHVQPNTSSLLPGDYRLQVWVDGQLVQAEAFVIRQPGKAPLLAGDWTLRLGVVQAGLDLSSVGYFVDSLGGLWVYAEVENKTDETLGAPRLAVRLGDFMKDDESTLTVFGPGKTALITVLILASEQPTGVNECLLDISTKPLTDFRRDYMYTDLQVENDDWAEPHRQYYNQAVAGQVLNVGNSTARHVKVMVAFYDEYDHIIYTAYAYIEADVLATGASSEFFIHMGHWERSAVAYRLWIEGQVADE